MTPRQLTIVRDMHRQLARLATGSRTPWHSSLQAIEEGHLQWVQPRHDGADLHWVCAFTDAVPGHAMPTRLTAPDGRSQWPVRSIRAPRVVRQANTASMQNSARVGAMGAMAAIVQSASDPRRLFALSAAHVLAGSEAACLSDSIDIDRQFQASLSDWLPVLGSTAVHTAIDAAIADISSDTAQALRARYPHLSINQTGRLLYYDQPLVVQTCDGPVPARYRGRWSGWIDAPDQIGLQDFWLEDACTYQAGGAGTQAGDSGSALIGDAGQLLGLHCAGDPGAQADWNAVGCRIEPILELLACTLGTTPPQTAAPLSRVHAQAPARAPRMGDGPPRPQADTLARTLWGEARGERETKVAMQAVANVVLNRCRRATWWGQTIEEVCRKRWQFSCWNVGDPNLPQLLRADDKDPAFALALDIAKQAVQAVDAAKGKPLAADVFKDARTKGATHYYADTLHTVPSWAAGKTPCALIGRHRFYNDIE